MPHPKPSSQFRLSAEEAEAIAISALAFVAQDPTLLPRFLAMTGIEAHHVREAAREPGFLAGVLRFVAAHEPTLLAFAVASGTDPSRIAPAIHALPGGDDRHEHST